MRLAGQCLRRTTLAYADPLALDLSVHFIFLFPGAVRQA
jgi:hypothetical protein